MITFAEDPKLVSYTVVVSHGSVPLSQYSAPPQALSFILSEHAIVPEEGIDDSLLSYRREVYLFRIAAALIS